jgi:hypothetical protein
LQLTLQVQGLPELHIAGSASFEVPAASNRAVALNLRIPSGAAPAGSHPVRIIITERDDPSMTLEEATTFRMPR